MPDEIIFINKDEIRDHRSGFLSHKISVHHLDIMVVQRYFCVGAYKYARPGSISNWVVLFKVSLGASYESQSVIEAISSAANQAPILLSSQKTSDYVASV